MIEGAVRIAEGTRLRAHVLLRGPLTIGRDNHIFPFCCLGYAPQDRSFDPDTDGAGTVIGDHNVIREGVTIHRATREGPTRLGSHNYMMAYAHLAHDVVVGDHCTLANGTMLAGHVHVADQVTFGGAAGVSQRCRVGRLAMLAGNESVTRDLPPFCTVYNSRFVSSLNLVGLRRAGHRDSIDPLKKAFDILFKQQHINSVATQRIRDELGDDPLCGELADFVDESTVGITTYAEKASP